jgi:hypothetical protein
MFHQDEYNFADNWGAVALPMSGTTSYDRDKLPHISKLMIWGL